MVVVSFLGNYYVFETNQTETIGRFKKALILAAWFSSVAFIGYAAFRLTKKTWAIRLWLLQYAFVLLLCIVYAMLYFFASVFPIAIKTAMASIRNFYLSPIPFALLILVAIIENKKSSKY